MKKTLAYILILTLLISLIGCTSDGSDTNEATTASQDKSEPQSEPQSESQSKEAEDFVINSAEVTFPKVSDERRSVESDASDAINLYLAARVYLDKFLQYDISSGNAEEYAALLDSTIEAFETAGVAAKMLEESAGQLEQLEANANYIPTLGSCTYVALNNSVEGNSALSDFNPFLYTVYAAEESEAVKWAKDITERFDSAPAGKGIRTLAEQMGTDAKHAYAQLKQAQDILAGNAYEDFAQTADAAYKTAKVLKTAGTAAQLTLSIVTANPVSTTEAVMACGGILVNGMNTLLEVGQTGSVLFVGDDNKLSQTLENMENSLAPIGSAIGLYGLGSNLAKGKKLFEDAPAMADSLMYIGSSLYDYVTEGKILGGTFKQAEDGTVSCEIVDTMTFKSAWAKEPAAAKELLEKVGYSEEEIAKVVEKADENPTETPEITDPLADISPEMIENILEEVAPVKDDNITLSEEAAELFEEFEVVETSESDIEVADNDVADNEVVDDVADDEISDDADEEEVSPEKDSSIPSIEEVVGYYPFYLYMTLGDQSGEAEVPQTITYNGGNSLTMTDADGYSMDGTYDASSGVATFHDSDGTPVKVTFSYDGDKIHASLKLIAEYGSMSGSMSGSVNKQ